MGDKKDKKDNQVITEFEINSIKPTYVYRPSVDNVIKKPQQPPNPFKKGGK